MRALCQQCGRPQPVDWLPGHGCVHCGQSVRAEQRCAACTEWVPSGRFCRACGAELTAEALYGAARMLVGAGVDRFALAARLHALEADQIENLQRLFALQLAAVFRRVDEVRFLERFLLLGGHAQQVEEAWIPKLPLAPAEVAALGAGPSGPFLDVPAALRDLAANSPLAGTRQLAHLARLRLGPLQPDSLRVARETLSAEAPLATEAALALSHWRTLLGTPSRPGGGTAIPALVEGAGLSGWRAVARARWLRGGDPDELRDLREGLAASEPDLRFACALALGEGGVVAEGLTSADPEQREVALEALAALGSSDAAISFALEQGPESEREAVLAALPDPLPAELASAALLAIERGSASARERAIWKLRGRLDAGALRRVLAVAARTADGRLVNGLLNAKGTLPEPVLLLALVVEQGLTELPWAGDALRAALESGRLPPGHLREQLLQDGGPLARDGQLSLLAGCWWTIFDPVLQRRLTALALSDLPLATRNRAVFVLARASDDGHPMLALDERAARALFGSLDACYAALTASLADAENRRDLFFHAFLAQLCRRVAPSLFPAPGRGEPAMELGGGRLALLEAALLAVADVDARPDLRQGALALVVTVMLADGAPQSPARSRVASRLDALAAESTGELARSLARAGERLRSP